MEPGIVRRMKNGLIDVTPGAIIKFFACPYVAGYSLQSAVDKADELLRNRGIHTTVDVLGESAGSEEAAVKFKDLYLRTIRAFAEHFPDRSTIPSVSLKPSSMVYAKEEGDGLEIDSETCESHIEEIARMAKSHDMEVTIDMEGHHWTDVTLKMFRSLRERGYDNVGTVLQSMLFRTDKDIDELPVNPRIRTCTGVVYAEPPRIAHQIKSKMKERLVEDTIKLLERGAYVELATHDENVIEKVFRQYIIPRDIPPERFEVQMLVGVPKEKICGELLRGRYLDYGKKVKVRLYVPFAEDEADALMYCKRRLAANPEIIKYGLVTFMSG